MRLRLGYIGLGLVQGWLWSFFLSGPVLNAVTQGTGTQAEKVFVCFLFFNTLSYLLASRLSVHYSPLLARRGLLVISGLLASAGPLLIGLFAAEPSTLPLPLIVFAAVAASGFGGAVLITAWGELTSHLKVKTAGLYFAGSVLLGTLLTFCCSSLGTVPALVLLACLPLVSLQMLLHESRDSKSDMVPNPLLAEAQTQKLGFPIPIRVVLMVAVYYLASGFMYRLISISWPFSSQESLYLSNAVYCGVTLTAGLCIYFIREVDLRFLYRPVLPLLGVGFLLFPLFSNAVQHVSFVLFQAGFALFDTYTWLLFVYLAARHRYPALVIGSGFFLITFFIMAGELSTALITPIFTAAPQDLNRISLLAALLMLVGTLAFQGKKETFAGWEAPFAGPDILAAQMETAVCLEQIEGEDLIPPQEAEPEPVPIDLDLAPASIETDGETSDHHPVLPADQDTVPAEEKKPDPVRLGDSYSYLEQVDRLTRAYGLTRRENEVLLMLLQGRNNPFIREQLNISNNTLKTHLRNLYNKLSVKNRQELLSLFVLIDGQPNDPSPLFPIH